jgi:hypothetical protein
MEVRLWQELLNYHFLAHVMRFCFTLIDPDNQDREFYFDLQVGDNYVLKDCQPPISEADMKPALRELNTTSDIGKFVKVVRKFFKRSV